MGNDIVSNSTPTILKLINNLRQSWRHLILIKKLHCNCAFTVCDMSIFKHFGMCLFVMTAHYIGSHIAYTQIKQNKIKATYRY